MKFLIFFLITIGFTRCNQKTDVQRLVEFINKPANKITQKITIGDVEMISKWLPASYRDLGLTGGKGAAEKRNDDTDYCYFNVRFEKGGGDKPDK
ncbi:MAG: hypothetical protein JSS98_01075, partial [Bacteroidetes bacterium]|nr:hypothetical protein [Bacteroidota bacterium]